MRVYSVNIAMYGHSQKQVAKKESQPVFGRGPLPIRLVAKPSIAARILGNNIYRNTFWSKLFDIIFARQDASAFLRRIDRTRLQPLFRPRRIESLRVKTNDFAHLQVETDGAGPLFVERNTLADALFDETGQDIIADGVRGFDPHDQADWEQMIGTAWPTAPDTRVKGRVARFIHKRDAIFVDPYPEVGGAYQTRPRAFSVVDRRNNSVIFAFQQENKNQRFSLASWIVMPFRIPTGKQTMAVFPVSRRTADRFKDVSSSDFQELRDGGQCSLDKSERFMMVDASKPSPTSAHMDNYADWAIFAAEGDKICLMRSACKDASPEIQFKFYSGSQNNGGPQYIELEFMAPRVPYGQKSTALCRMDYISLKDLGLPALTKENMNRVLQQAADIIEGRINRVRNIFDI